jgi:hypothetical protein
MQGVPMERTNVNPQSVEAVVIPSKEAVANREDLVAVVAELRWSDLVALDELQRGEMDKVGVRLDRSEIIRSAIQFYYEKHQGVII